MIDLYGSSIEIWIEKPDGTRRSLHNLAVNPTEQIDGTRPQFTNFVESVRVTINLLQVTQIEITLTPPLNEAINLINSGLLGMGVGAQSEAVGQSDGSFAKALDSLPSLNKLKLRLHSGGLSSKFMTGFLLVPDFSISPEGIQIKLKAIGTLWSKSNVSSQETIENKKAEEVLFNLSGNGNDFVVKVPDDDAEAKKRMSEVVSMNQNGNNLTAIKNMLRNKGLVMIDSGAGGLGDSPEIMVKSYDYMLKTSSGREFVIFNQIDPNRGIFPIYSIDATIATYMTAQLGESVVTTIRDKQATDTKAAADSVTKFTGGMVSTDGSMAGSSALGEGQKIASPVEHESGGSLGNAASAILGNVFEALTTPFQLKFSTPAIVDQLPGQTVKVRVADAKFLVGEYFCTEVVHEISNDGATTDFTVAKTFGLEKLASKGIENIKSAISKTDPAKNVKTSTTSGLL